MFLLLQKSDRKLTEFFRYLRIVITKIWMYLKWIIYIKSYYLRIPRNNFLLIGMSFNHEEMPTWNASIWVRGPCIVGKISSIFVVFLENMNFKSPLFSIFRWPLLPFGQNRKIPSGTGMAIFTWHSSTIWIRVTNPGQCGLPCCMFLPSTVGRRRVCLLSVPFNIL